MTGVGGSRAGTQTRSRGTVPTHTGAAQANLALRCAYCCDGGRHRTNIKAGGW